MSVNQSRGDKNEPPQYRRLGRSSNSAVQRNYSGSGGRGGGGGGGGSTNAVPSSASFSSNRSFKKVGNNAQGVQARVNSPNSNSNLGSLNNSASGGTTVPNGSHLQGATVKSSDVSTQKSTPGVPKVPQGNADAPGPVTPTKSPADASRAFPLQFGSISPGLMNGMQIPARTSSAPPNLDEQKQAQARLDSSKPTKFPTPAVPKQPLPTKDTGPVDQPIPKPKKDVQTLPASPSTQPQKLPGLPVPPVSMQHPFHHSQLHVQYGPNPPTNTSLPVPLPMPLPIGNPPQPVFVTGMQHHPMPPQGIIHQMGPQPPMPSPLGNIGLGLGPQYQQSPPGKLNAQRKTVKITHPDTHEELRLDKSGGSPGSGPRLHPHPHPHGMAQSQPVGPVPSFPPGHPMNYYSNSYNTSPLFFQASGSQAPMFYNQVTVKPAAISDLSLPKTVEDSVSLVNSGVDVAKRATVSKPGSFKEEHMNPIKKVQLSSLDQVSGQSTSISNSTSQSPGHRVSSDGGPETLKPSTPSGTKEDVSETGKKAVPAGVTVTTPVNPIETIRTETNSDSSIKIDRPNPEPIGPEEQENAITNEPDQHEVTTSSINNQNQPEISSLDSRSSRGDDIGNSDVSLSGFESKGVDNVEISRAKGNMGKPKKKRKDILKFADAQGTTSDLYNAYKGPEEKKETETSPIFETVESPSGLPPISEKDVPLKFEPDDWEDVVDISTPKLETSVNGNDGLTKKYSRDFLLKFSEQCTDLPQGFEITSDIAEAVISSNVNVSRDPGRVGDRPGPGPRLDRRPSNIGHDDRWNKTPGRDMRVDIGYAGTVPGFRPVHGVLRNPRGPAPVQYAGGILAGPMQSPGPHGVMQRNNSDSDRWQRVAGNQKGLIPSPQTLIPIMHKAERKYKVGKVTDEEQAKQRQLKGILNKLTPQNFEKLFEQVKQVNIDNAETLSGVIAQIFDKALMEPTFCEMYANFCSRLSAELPDFSEDNEKITFKRLLLNKCQEEFERGEREEQEANRTDEEGEVKQTEEEREEKRVKARRRMLGNIRLIGELYKKKMLTERIMHECIKKLLGQYQNPDEEDIEALCKLMSTIGSMIDHPIAKEHMDVYFDTMSRLSKNMKLSSRVRFMLKDAIDLRKNKWQQRRKVEGPKMIEEVHRDAAQERHAQSSRLARGPSFNSSVRRGGQGQQVGSFRGLPQQPVRGFVNQDARFEERPCFENRALAVPVRLMGDHSITLGPQGGLARGMSARGQGPPLIQSVPVAGPNGYGSREDFVPRYVPERLAPSPAYDQSNLNRVSPSSPPTARVWVPSPTQNVVVDKVWPEDRLRDMSIDAIKEYYSARDEKEVVQCIKDLNAPSFYPSMISIWVTDSFERKDGDRDSLAKLLVNLRKSQDRMISQDSLVRGLESVLTTLEDSVNDAPRAAEFLGRILAKVLLENVIPYEEIWRLIYQGGEEQGQLVEIGLAAEVLGVILETIKFEKGDLFLNEIRTRSHLHVENFRPPNIKKLLRLDKFV